MVQSLDELMLNYRGLKFDADQAKGGLDIVRSKLVKALEEKGLDEYSALGLRLTKTEVNMDKMNQDKLLAAVKENCSEDIQKKLIRTQEYIDLDALEDLVYNRVIDPDLVNKCIDKRPVSIRINLREEKS